MDYQLSFEGFVFQNGDGSPLRNGGSIFLAGVESSSALFTNCDFIAHGGWYADSARGGAISAMNGGVLMFSGCLFENNSAFFGSAIYAPDVQITIVDTEFRSNFVPVAVIDVGDNGKVTCLGEGNVLDSTGLDILGSTENCEDFNVSTTQPPTPAPVFSPTFAPGLSSPDVVIPGCQPFLSCKVDGTEEEGAVMYLRKIGPTCVE